MLAVPLALWEEFNTTQTILEQAQYNPTRVVLITLAILIGTCAPILRYVQWVAASGSVGRQSLCPS